MGRKTPPRPSNRQNQEKSGRNPQKEGRTMKKKIWALGLVWLLLLGAAALADGGNWHESRIYGSVQLANYAGWCDGYQSVDGFGGITAADSFTLTVISKSASIWSEPSTGSKKLGSVSYGESLTGRFQRRRKQRRDGSQLSTRWSITADRAGSARRMSCATRWKSC